MGSLDMNCTVWMRAEIKTGRKFGILPASQLQRAALVVDLRKSFLSRSVLRDEVG